MTEEIWDAVQAKLKENKEFEEVTGPRGGRPHFLYGKVFCGECGQPMVRKSWGRQKVRIFRERNKGSKGNGCKGRNIKEEELLGYESQKIIVKKDGLDVL